MQLEISCRPPTLFLLFSMRNAAQNFFLCWTCSGFCENGFANHVIDRKDRKTSKTPTGKSRSHRTHHSVRLRRCSDNIRYPLPLPLCCFLPISSTGKVVRITSMIAVERQWFKVCFVNASFVCFLISFGGREHTWR